MCIRGVYGKVGNGETIFFHAGISVRTLCEECTDVVLCSRYRDSKEVLSKNKVNVRSVLFGIEGDSVCENYTKSPYVDTEMIYKLRESVFDGKDKIIGE